MTREEAITGLKVLRKDFSGYKPNEEMLDMAIKALEQEPMENFESVKDHILKLASDYKCWDNRLTYDEALELCHILEQEPCENAISRQAVKEQMLKYGFHAPDMTVIEFVEDILPVNPQPNTDVLEKIRSEIESKCDRINSLASVLPYTAHREIQELLCEIMDLFEPQEARNET